MDSRAGDDRNTGLQPTATSAAATGAGPWRSLLRVMQSDIGPGDSLILACGSEWRETLRLPRNGLADRPIVVTAPTAGCGTVMRPTIDGGVPLAAAAWVQHTGSIWRASLDAAPLQLSAASGVLNEAHHPNRGHDARWPLSTYLPMADNGEATTPGSTGSTLVVTGTDLVLPAGAQITPGTRVRIRTNSWSLEERTVVGTNANRVLLATSTKFPAMKGWGYFLVGQAWMLDSPGEWHYDATTRRLFAWMPDSTAPAQTLYASTLAIGADLAGRAHIAIDGLGIRRVGLGIALGNATSIQVRNIWVEDTAGNGTEAAGSKDVVIESNAFNRVGQDAITGQGTNATGMVIRNNLIRDSGVIMSGTSVASLPVNSFAAIHAGPGATVTGNSIINSGYIGIRFMPRSLVQNNFVFGACAVLDDCAGLYSWGGGINGSTLRGNVIVRLRGGLEGKLAGVGSEAQGIFLDENTTAVTVEGNTVVDAENGLQLHNARDNTIRQNSLFGNRRSAIWFLETANAFNANGDLSGNTVENNAISATSSAATGFALQTKYPSTTAFGSFRGNRYLDRISPTIVQERTARGSKNFTLREWQTSQGVGSTAPVDQTGWGLSSTPFSTYRPTGSNLVPNSNLAVNLAGWAHWNQTPPSGSIRRETCPAGMCVRYVAGGSPGQLTSPNFSVAQGQWYRLSVDLATDQDRQDVTLMVRRGGGGNNGFESLADRSLIFQGRSSWQRFSVTFQATKTVNAADPTTGDLGARVDAIGMTAGASLSMANLEIIPIAFDAMSPISGVLVNAGATQRLMECPVAGTEGSFCASLRELEGHSQVAWPMLLAPGASVAFYGQNPGLADSDNDGIANTFDQCPNSSPGSAVNARGCAFPDR